MEPCTCAHEQQVRHLKSRVSQLEMMLDKAHRRLNTGASTPAVPPAASRTQDSPAVISTTESKEYRTLQADLESERKIKMDLMANLKEATVSHQEAQARLVQRLEQTEQERDAAAASLDDLQEAFEAVRGMFPLQVSTVHDGDSTSANLAESGVDLGHGNASMDQATRLNASVLRTFCQQIEKSQETRTRSILLTIAQHCPSVGSVSECDNESLEMNVVQAISTMAAGCLSSAELNDLRALTRPADRATSNPSRRESDCTAGALIDSIAMRLKHTDDACEAFSMLLYKQVPATFEDIFILLNRSSSFSYPEKEFSFGSSPTESYQSYLRSLTSSLNHTIRKYISSHQKSRQKISYRAFGSGDLALFLPTRNAYSPAWAAFNVGAPHYFLLMDGVETEGKDFLIGRIQDITEKSGEPGVESAVVSTPGGVVDPRKWWEVKITEKKKAGA